MTNSTPGDELRPAQKRARTLAFRVPTSSPSDTSGLEALFEEGRCNPSDVVAILGKTEGNGGRNDFTRELCQRALADVFARRLGISAAEVEDRVVLSLSGGTEGVMSPHLVVFARTESSAPAPNGAPPKRLAIGIGYTRSFAPEEIGRRAQVDETARVLREIANSLGLSSTSDIHLVQMKGAIPASTYAEEEAARQSGRPLRNNMVYSRGASALAAGIVTGEVPSDAVTDDAICRDWTLYSGVASVSAKPKLKRTEILMLANSPAWDGDLVIGHDVMRDIIDAGGVRRALAHVGVDLTGRHELTDEERERIIGVFAKSEADERRTVRGFRHTMLQDDDIGDTRYSRCVVAAVCASVVGATPVYVSTRAEHHGPQGGGPVAIVARAP